jgi:hypothetical protein
MLSIAAVSGRFSAAGVGSRYRTIVHFVIGVAVASVPGSSGYRSVGR